MCQNPQLTYSLKLGKEYYHKGLVEIPSRYWDFFPNARVVISIVKHNNNEVIAGTFYCAGGRRTINGKIDLQNYYETHFNLGDSINVCLCNDGRVHLSPLQ